MRPIRRTEGLVLREVDEQTIVYDLASEQVTCLDPDSSVVFAACEGRDVDDLARATGLTEQAVVEALVRLTDAGLLAEASVSRRALVARWGTAAALAPLITMAAPAAIAAASTLSAPAPTISYGSACTFSSRSGWNLTYSIIFSHIPPGSGYKLRIYPSASFNGSPSNSTITVPASGIYSTGNIVVPLGSSTSKTISVKLLPSTGNTSIVQDTTQTFSCGSGGD